ncbi:MAG: hypothetical protein A2798_02440 [Candidatus Levybacteria bacterium RIFCSPHIGHO2_01_FULL_37_17]|nr:MAG: hypothetical protein A2798_02440 [Candidatus Levybacteria bacterium RIFCSPHIGHO2_01_FULL_37_17]OGH36729.1 MAG: hypothetical protein A2959_00430 [Candidatus Levybacteria bacterium RIFCSPLOWO2_01_FULL_38_23]
MITIIHGSDTASSRKYYIEQKESFPSYVLIENANYDTIFQSAEGDSLFNESEIIFIENFFSNVKGNSNEYKKIVEYISSNNKNDFFLWEEKELSKPQQYAFKNAQLKTFNYPASLFTFLDSLKPRNSNSLYLFKQLEKNMETELIFYMLVRQFRLLLSTQDSSSLIDEAKRLQAWQKLKLQRQANIFGSEKLKNLHKKLYEIDYQTKFGLTPFKLSASIDIFLADL